MIRVLVIERHAVVREGLRPILAVSPDIALVGATSSAGEALQLLARAARREGIDVVVTDLDPPGLDLATLVHRVVALAPRAAVLTLTLRATPSARRIAQPAGAVGCVRMQEAVRDLVPAIRAVARVPD